MKTKIAHLEAVFYDKTEAYEQDECEVRINDGEIVVSYEDDDGIVVYKGKDAGNGHFDLKCPKRNARASLHQFPEGKILEGYWIEGGSKGFWRITLP